MTAYRLTHKVCSLIVALILATSGWLAAVQPAAAATTSYGFTLSSNMLPDPLGDIAEEFTDFESISVSGTKTDNADGSGEMEYALAVAVADSANLNDTDGTLDGNLTTNVTVTWDKNKKVTDVDVGVEGNASAKFQLLKFAKVVKIAKLVAKSNKYSKRLGELLDGIELDAGVYLYIDAAGAGTVIGSDVSTLSFSIGLGAEIEDVRLGSFHLNEYASGSVQPLSFGIAYTPAENTWELTFEPSYNLQLLKIDDEYLIDWEQEWNWTIYENGEAITDPIPDEMGGEVVVIEKDAGITGDAGDSQGSARDLGTVSYVVHGGLLNGNSDEDWYEITIANTDMPISLKLQPPDNGDYDLYVKSDTGTVAAGTEVVFQEDWYDSVLYFKVYRQSGEAGHYHFDVRYYQTAEAVQVSVAEGTGEEARVTLAGQTQTTENGKTIFLDVPYGEYTVSATENGTGYSGSEEVEVGSLLEAFVVNLNAPGPDTAYDAGDDYDDMLLPDYSTMTEGKSAHKGWVKVSDRGETLYVKCQDMACKGTEKVYLIVNDGDEDDDNLILENGGSEKYGGMKIYIDTIFCGIDNAHGVKVDMYYEGYDPAKPRTPTGASAVNAGGIGVYTAKTTDTDGDQVKYTFDWGDGSPNETTGLVDSGQEVSLSHTWDTPGAYTVKVKATDDEGLASDWSSGLSVVVNALPTAAFTFSPTSPTTDDTVSFTDGSSDADGTIVAWEWNFGDDETSVSQNPTHQYTAAGDYEVSLTVTDDKGGRATTSQEVIVSEAVNVLPTAAFTFSPTSPTTDDTVSFTDDSSDEDGTIVAWEWNFGDDETSVSQNPTHQYTAASDYEVSLTVTDDKGGKATTSQEVIVTTGATPTPQSDDIALTTASDIWFSGSWFPGEAITEFTTSSSGGYLYLTAHTGSGQSKDIIVTTRSDTWFSNFDPGDSITGFTTSGGGGYLYLAAHAANGRSKDIVMTTSSVVWFANFEPGRAITGFDSDSSGDSLYLTAYSQ